MFACRRDAWPGLNPQMRGQGGEEGYVHEKVRRGGGRAVCHPGVQWLHRFARPGGILYPTRWRDRAQEAANPYAVAFDAMVCLHRDATQRRWARARFAALGVDWLVEPVVLPPASDLGAAEAKAVRFLAASAKRRA